jgi:TPR repeat protein
LWFDGWCSEHGIGVALDLSGAADLYRDSAERGFVFGRYDDALFVCHGIGVKRNRQSAVDQIRLAAEQGNADAMFEYGI